MRIGGGRTGCIVCGTEAGECQHWTDPIVVMRLAAPGSEPHQKLRIMEYQMPFMLDRRLWLTEDRARVVEDGDPDAAYLLSAGPGEEIPFDEARRLGLVGDTVLVSTHSGKVVDTTAPEKQLDPNGVVLNEAAFPAAGDTPAGAAVASHPVETKETPTPWSPREPEVADKAIRGPKEPARKRG